MSFADFLMANWYVIVSIAVTVASIVWAIIKQVKAGNTKGIVALLELIPSLVITAESLYGKGKGSAKLDYVLTQLRLYALQHNIKVNTEDLTAQINSVVETTNNVNMDKPALVKPSQEAQTGLATDSKPVDTQDTVNI